MKLLLDFFPVVLFFLAFKLAGLIPATVVIMIATLAQVGFQWFRHKRLEPMHLITLGVVLVLGLATVLLRDERFIKMKPTLIYVILALVFLGSQFVGSRKPLIERLAGESMTLPARIWARLNLSWAAFFVALAVTNVIVANHVSTETWVNFKLFGLLGLTLVFTLLQGIVMTRFAEEKKLPTQDEATKP